MIERVHPPITEKGLRPALLWAAFLGSSWTWIIGMVLPVLLVADYGFWGWAVFAVPNILGAGAMGFVLSNEEMSRKVSGKHRDMCLRFSEITVVFHFFVIGWLYQLLFGWWGVGAACGFGVVCWLMAQKRAGTMIATVLVTAASFVMAGIGFGLNGAWEGLVGIGGEGLRLSSESLWFFLPASVLGFLLCPYLDLTFHRARQSTSPGVGKAAFALGFGVVFCTMIVFTLAYSGLLRPVVLENKAIELPRIWLAILAVHMTLQAGYTIGLHGREMNLRMGKAGVMRMIFLGVVGVLLGYMSIDSGWTLNGLTSSEVAYRTFLMCYGLAFPAYVWLCMIPTLRKDVSGKGRAVIWLIATLAGAPLVFGFFVMGYLWWMVYLLGVLVLARVVVELLPMGKAVEVE
ncbi:hypothetical protein KS4_05770 [Poriferisphaera corsica]|uniref:Uncharacterized protein n=1 Tax=Poriferisphaera corsica TaxID=2528020 RepID=A0A517YQR2_9BACT|nr:hypothetical protein [Poriferisphaera corsica]QDU32545.1 hypothetical protein KS4_05770 [Poriferisphaera corsica]